MLRNISVSKAELSKKLDSTEFTSFKDSVVTKTELAEKGYLTQPYNDSEVKQRLTTLENRPTGGGNQKRDTGWVIIKDGNDGTGNILKIRRIEDMVHVQISNKSGYGLIIEESYSGYNFAGYSLPTPGFNTLTSILLPVTKSPQHIQANPNHIDVLGQAVFEVKNGELTMNVFANSSQEDETHINSFSYFTEDPFPAD